MTILGIKLLWRVLVALLTVLQRVERGFGRKRWRRWGARVLDLDLLAFGQQVLTGDRLRVPHPELHRRLFVLAPMREVVPGWRHPRLGLTVRQMLDALPQAARDEVVPF